jgi:hypothetical protein
MRRCAEDASQKDLLSSDFFNLALKKLIAIEQDWF